VRLLALAPVVSNFIAYPFQQAANSWRQNTPVQNTWH
jgi:hypothetical protein